MLPKNVSTSQVYHKLAGDYERIFLFDRVHQSSLRGLRKQGRENEIKLSCISKNNLFFLFFFSFSLTVH